MQEQYNCYASAAFGMEGLVSSELRELNMREVAAENGGVRFSADPEDLFRCNLWMHFCERIFIIAAEKECVSFEELYQLVLSVPWELFAQGNEAINISAKCARSKLMSPRDCQSITKKAILDRLRKANAQKIFPEDGPSLPVHVSVHTNLVKILINTTGEALSRRGYRTWNGEAPIRETLAAALVRLSPWKPEMPLYDPCCGTGTILIEAALMQEKRAPGLKRNYAMESMYPFRMIDFSAIRDQESKKSVQVHMKGISGSDISPEAVDLATRHIRQAGVTETVGVVCKPLQEVSLNETKGVFICNPPYGERLSDRQACRKLYHDLRMLKERHPTWSMCVISSDPSFERSFGKKADKKRRLYNGRLECVYYIYY